MNWSHWQASERNEQSEVGHHQGIEYEPITWGEHEESRCQHEDHQSWTVLYELGWDFW